MTSKNNLNKIEGNLQRNKCNSLSESYPRCLIAIRKNNGRGDALREVGREKPVSNNTKPTPVKVIALENTSPLRARDCESAAYSKFSRSLRSKCCPSFDG